MERLRIGVIGVGTISGIYLENLTDRFDNRIEVLGCADLDPTRAQNARAEFSLPREYESPEALLRDDDIELVLNLTVPAAHFEVCLATIESGKHSYVEKPMCLELEQAARLIDAAKREGVQLGGAPDTFLGAGIQTCRKLIDDRWIGKPIGAVAFMALHGHESWHPNPEFYYKKGGGPMFDMGPYYITALVNLVGPVHQVSGAARTTFPERVITSQPKAGTVIDVEVPTHVVGTLEFDNGAVGTIITSFDVWDHNLPWIEIYGTDGSLCVPDPNTFAGPVRVARGSQSEWAEIPLSHKYASNSRGLGVAEMAEAIRNDRPARASATLTSHVLEIMHGIHIAAENGERYRIQSDGVRPEALAKAF